MKTIQLSERELSMIFSMLTPPYAVSDTHTDEFNELRNKVFYALRDAQNDEPVSDAYKLPVGWVAVPVEPTEAMINAYRGALYSGESAVSCIDLYKAMIAAAPQQEE